ncbi:MAG TPA: SDR family NAD(P)-dependent oxidoreductase [Vicinamibacterales bacterium]|nr:SDR family NAD(P)-dependent oxidoreductase [Vicinamibacterales bacterium]
MQLTGRVAAITGASSGIGLACADGLAREGVAVVLGARRADRLQAAVERIRASGGAAEAVTTDVTVAADVEALVQKAVSGFGRLDIMICNAGFGYYGTVEETPPDVMRRMLDVNFMGTFYGARAALPIFRRQGHGHLLLISSITGRRGIGFMSGYAATKAAQTGFAESLRAEFAGTGIHVSVVFPVSTPTEFREVIERDYGYTVSSLGPVQPVAEVADAVVRCVRRPRPEVYPYRRSRVLAVLNAFAPGFTDGFVRRFERRRTVQAKG